MKKIVSLVLTIVLIAISANGVLAASNEKTAKKDEDSIKISELKRTLDNLNIEMPKYLKGTDKVKQSQLKFFSPDERSSEEIMAMAKSDKLHSAATPSWFCLGHTQMSGSLSTITGFGSTSCNKTISVVSTAQTLYMNGNIMDNNKSTAISNNYVQTNTSTPHNKFEDYLAETYHTGAYMGTIDSGFTTDDWV